MCVVLINNIRFNFTRLCLNIVVNFTVCVSFYSFNVFFNFHFSICIISFLDQFFIMATSILQIIDPSTMINFHDFLKTQKKIFFHIQTHFIASKFFRVCQSQNLFLHQFSLIISTIVDDKIKVIFVEYYQYLSEFPYQLISDCQLYSRKYIYQ